MCDRCKTMRHAVETALETLKEQYPPDFEYHIAQMAARDANLDTQELRKAFASVGPNFHLAMALMNVAAEEILEANRYDTMRALATATDAIMSTVARRNALLRADTTGPAN